jgi:hypothetical protein
MLKNILYAISIVICMTACPGKKTDPVPSNSSTGICYTTSSTTDGSKDFDGMYNGNNKLDSMIDYTSSADVQFKVKYDANNRVIKSIWYYAGTEIAYLNSHYNASGQRDKDTLYKINPAGPPAFIADSVILYTYTGNQITRADFYNIASSPSHVYSTYSYNSAGELTLESDYDGSSTLLQTITNTYDTKPANTTLIEFLDPISGGQTHNILTQVTKISGTTVDVSNSYSAASTYNSNGYPLTETDTYQDGVTVDNISFTYTCK